MIRTIDQDPISDVPELDFEQELQKLKDAVASHNNDKHWWQREWYLGENFLGYYIAYNGFPWFWNLHQTMYGLSWTAFPKGYHLLFKPKKKDDCHTKLWECERCSEINCYPVMMCKKCGSSHLYKRKKSQSLELKLICRTYETCDANCKPCQGEVDSRIETIKELREFRDSLDDKPEV